MKKLYTFLIVLFFVGGTMGQTDEPCESCLPEGIIFTTQAQVDSFPINYPWCNIIEGDVEIRDWVKSIDSLYSINTIGGDLEIRGLKNLNGLNNLESINGSLIIRYSDSLVNFSGLESLGFIGGNMEILSPWSLADFTGLDNLNAINGDLIIEYCFSLEDITSLNGLDYLGGNLRIYSTSLINLNGLNNLDTIHGDFELIANHELTSLTGLENLKTVQGNLRIKANSKLQSLVGLNELETINGDFWIYHNTFLSELEGLDNLVSIGEDLYIFNNPIEDLDALSGLVSLKGDIIILGNHNLSSIDGLSNIEMDSVSDLSIYDNTSLTICNTQNICNYLQDPNGVVRIFQNAEGCNTPVEIANNCGYTLGCLPYGDYYFISQQNIYDFQQNYNGCSKLGGDVYIGGEDIVDLSGLDIVESIDGNLLIGDSYWPGGGQSENPFLSSLTGLNNLDSIGGSLNIQGNPSLSNLSGLNDLNSIGGWLIVMKSSLTNLTGLENLKFVGQDLQIGGGFGGLGGNQELLSLDGIENIVANSIDSIAILNNPMLSKCHVISICDYLASPNGEVLISGNAIGCNSTEEVLDSCEAHAGIIDVLSMVDGLLIYPNPSSTQITIELPNQPSNNTSLTISNTNGQQLITQPITEPQTEIDISYFPAGIYIVKVWNDKDVMVQKMIKQ